jgi:hypothetical protein
MGDATAMPNLAVNASAGGMYRIGDPSPCGDLVGTVKTRRRMIPCAWSDICVHSVTISPADARWT